MSQNSVKNNVHLKKKTASMALFLTLAITAALVAFPAVYAHTPPWTVVSYAYVTVGPDPVGVGQRVLILMWVDGPMLNAALENDIRRVNYTLTITDPNGGTEVKNWPTVADPTSTQFLTYTPVLVGTYTLKFDYGGQTYTWNATSSQRTWTNDILMPASATTTFTVQEEPLPQPKTSYPLPTEYWMRPIEGQNTEWYAISSNWLGEPYITSGVAVGGGTAGNYFGKVQPDGTAPNSAHVMWSKPIQDGGVVGGNNSRITGEMYYSGGSYNTRFSNPLIMYGRLYYQEPYGNSGSGGDLVAVDLRTGEELWRTNATGIGVPSFGYLLAFDNANQHGILPNGLLFTNNFARSYDPRTGIDTTLNVTNVPSAASNLAQVIGPQGEILRYGVTNFGNATNPNWRLTQWNSSRVVGYESSTGVGGWYSGNIPGNTPFNTTTLGSNTYWNGSAWVSNTVRQQQGYAAMQWTTPAYDWNVSVSLPNSGSWRIDRASYDNIMLLVQGSFGGHPTAPFGIVSLEGANLTAVSLKPNDRGRVLWTKYFPPAGGNVTRSLDNWDPERGVFILGDKETRVLHGYSLATGEKLWTTEPTNVYSYFRTFPAVAYGRVYFAGYGGVLYTYNITDGKLLWTYGNGGEGNSTFGGLEISYGHYPIFIDVIADGKIFLATTEHSPNSPFYKDARYRAINATTGEEIWTLMGWGTGMDATYDLAADGSFVFLNTYDMQIYTVGKGPSSMTIEAPMNAITFGSSLVIRGTVMDVSAGTKQKEQAARFPQGVPAISDGSMTGWMEYVYMQKPRPSDATGVEVTISVLDANNNFREIGKTKSNSDGFFTLNWKPDIEGPYTVYASFAGSESYWPSNAVTSFAVDPAPPPPAAPEPQPPSMTDTYVLSGVAAIIGAVGVATAVIVLILRKRP